MNGILSLLVLHSFAIRFCQWRDDIVRLLWWKCRRVEMQEG